jgi:hypothetical protein
LITDATVFIVRLGATRYSKGKAVSKLVSTTALAAAILATGLALQTPARAAEPGYIPIGDIGTRYNGQCWIATAPGINTYFGYWGACPKATPGPHKY